VGPFSIGGVGHFSTGANIQEFLFLSPIDAQAIVVDDLRHLWATRRVVQNRVKRRVHSTQL
jgi:hypothetical protein